LRVSGRLSTGLRPRSDILPAWRTLSSFEWQIKNLKRNPTHREDDMGLLGSESNINSITP
jgi:hypothetical protein